MQSVLKSVVKEYRLTVCFRTQGSGCGSVIDLLVSCLADEGEGILVARPFYNGFAASFECRSGVIPIGVDLDVPVGEESGVEAIAAYERKLLACRKDGMVVRAIMICNPHNPLGQYSNSSLVVHDRLTKRCAGFCYPKETLLAYAAFAQKYDLHLISDEIYALSVFKTEGSYCSSDIGLMLTRLGW